MGKLSGILWAVTAATPTTLTLTRTSTKPDDPARHRRLQLHHGDAAGRDIMLNYQTTAFHDTATVRQY